MTIGNHTKGFFITLEGLEGAGKTTQAKLLFNTLQKEGYPCLLTSEPGGTPLGTQIRNILKDNKYSDMTPLAELMLFASARAQHVEQIIRPSLEEGKIVLCDRFFDATLAYQCFGRGLPENLIREINSRASWNVRPDITFFLDIEPSKGLNRVSQRIQQLEVPADRIEKESLAFFEKVRQGYLYISREEPLRIRVLNGDDSVENIKNKMWDTIKKELLRLKFKQGLSFEKPVIKDEISDTKGDE